MSEDTGFETLRLTRGGWTTWITPVHKKYLMKCCDCGLVHEFQFKVIKQLDPEVKKEWQGGEVLDKSLRVAMRARRQKEQTP